MRRYLLDMGIAGHFLYRRRGVYQRAKQDGQPLGMERSGREIKRRSPAGGSG